MEGGGNADKEIPAWKLGSSAKCAAFGLPDIVVINELTDVAASIEQGGQCDGQDDGDFYNFFSGDGNTLLSHASRSRHCSWTWGPQQRRYASSWKSKQITRPSFS